MVDSRKLRLLFDSPPRLSCNSRVNLESRYGMCFCLPSTNAEITLPNAERDKLIFVASLNRSPVAPVFRNEEGQREKERKGNVKNDPLEPLRVPEKISRRENARLRYRNFGRNPQAAGDNDRFQSKEKTFTCSHLSWPAVRSRPDRLNSVCPGVWMRRTGL